MDIKKLSLIELYDISKNIKRLQNMDLAASIDAEIKNRESFLQEREQRKFHLVDFAFKTSLPTGQIGAKYQLNWLFDGYKFQTVCKPKGLFSSQNFGVNREGKEFIKAKAVENKYGIQIEISVGDEAVILYLNSMTPYDGFLLCEEKLIGIYDNDTLAIVKEISNEVANAILSILSLRSSVNTPPGESVRKIEIGCNDPHFVRFSLHFP